MDITTIFLVFLSAFLGYQFHFLKEQKMKSIDYAHNKRELKIIVRDCIRADRIHISKTIEGGHVIPTPALINICGAKWYAEKEFAITRHLQEDYQDISTYFRTIENIKKGLDTDTTLGVLLALADKIIENLTKLK